MNLSTAHRDILRIALPSIASNITVPLLGLIDLAIVGHLDSAAYIGAIAVGGTVFNMIYWIFAFLRMGTTGLSAQEFGKRNPEGLVNTLLRSCAVGLFISLLLVILQVPIERLALHLMAPTADVRTYATLYFGICIWGAPAVLGQYSLTGWMLGVQEARYPFYVALLQNLTNIACSLLFVYGFRWGVAGVAAGTLVAQYAGWLASLLLTFHIYKRYKDDFRLSARSLWKREALTRFFTVNRDIFFRTLCLVSVTTYFTSAGARQGDLILAVNALLMQYFILYSYFMDGIAFAGEALSGRFSGAGQHRKLQHTVKHLFLWGGGLATGFTLLYLFGGRGFMQLLTDQPAVIEAARSFLPWVCLIPVAGLAAFIWDGVFIGLTATRQMLLSMATATVVFFTAFLSLESIGGNHALWLAFLLYLFTRGATQTVFYRTMVPFNTPTP